MLRSINPFVNNDLSVVPQRPFLNQVTLLSNGAQRWKHELDSVLLEGVVHFRILSIPLSEGNEKW